MNCSCDYEGPTVYVCNRRVARSHHQCDECGAGIVPGSRYERAFGVWDGRAEAFKTCTPCLALRDYVAAHIPCTCWGHGDMIDDIMEEAANWSPEAPGLLFGAWRRRIAIDRARQPATNGQQA